MSVKLEIINKRSYVVGDVEFLEAHKARDAFIRLSLRPRALEHEGISGDMIVNLICERWEMMRELMDLVYSKGAEFDEKTTTPIEELARQIRADGRAGNPPSSCNS